MIEHPQISRQEITLCCMQNGEHVRVATTARTRRGLALHKTIGKKREYTLTHLTSSLPLVTGIRLSVGEQDTILIELAALLDWYQPYDAIVSQWVHDTALKEDVQRLYRKLHGESEGTHAQ